MYAIKNVKTNKWVYGTDYRYHPRRQRTSHNKALTYEYEFEVETDFIVRHCGKDYKIVEVELREV